jgi:hypothetical protein
VQNRLGMSAAAVKLAGQGGIEEAAGHWQNCKGGFIKSCIWGFGSDVLLC